MPERSGSVILSHLFSRPSGFMQQPTSLKQAALSVSQLSFSIKHKKLIDNISFSIPQGKKVALVGLNGAGKSTLIKLLVGEYKKQQGDILFTWQEPENNKARTEGPDGGTFKANSGYQACSMQALNQLTCQEYLHMCCELKGLAKKVALEQINAVTRLWHLTADIEQQMQKLSQGNLQKLAIAQAFLSQPDFIFLDEPTQALDPLEQKRFIDNLNSLKTPYLCLFSSHHINETVAAADLVLMLHKGRLIALIDLKAEDEHWFVSGLDIKQIGPLLQQNQSLTLFANSNKNKLYRLQGVSQGQWQALSKKLIALEPGFNGLGSSKQSLMPLFALLANESF